MEIVVDVAVVNATRRRNAFESTLQLIYPNNPDTQSLTKVDLHLFLAPPYYIP